MDEFSINGLKFQETNAKVDEFNRKRGQLNLNHFYFPVSFGTLLVSWNSSDLLSRITWFEGRAAPLQKVKIPSQLLGLIEEVRVFCDQGTPFKAIPWEKLDQSEWTTFQKDVYLMISKIPHGETRTYGWVASNLGKKAASRAVGQALKKNPLPILIPCHRICSSHTIGGFLGVNDPSQAEVKLKQSLISMEEEYKNPFFSFVQRNNFLKDTLSELDAKILART